MDLLLGVFFFFNDTATTEIYTLSLHDALPICCLCFVRQSPRRWRERRPPGGVRRPEKGLPEVRRRNRIGRTGSSGDRKSTRLNSSHANISYAVFCLKKKKINCSALFCMRTSPT